MGVGCLRIRIDNGEAVISKTEAAFNAFRKTRRWAICQLDTILNDENGAGERAQCRGLVGAVDFSFNPHPQIALWARNSKKSLGAVFSGTLTPKVSKTVLSLKVGKYLAENGWQRP
jgi:hypothetical protein